MAYTITNIKNDTDAFLTMLLTEKGSSSASSSGWANPDDAPAVSIAIPAQDSDSGQKLLVATVKGIYDVYYTMQGEQALFSATFYGLGDDGVVELPNLLIGSSSDPNNTAYELDTDSNGQVNIHPAQVQPASSSKAA